MISAAALRNLSRNPRRTLAILATVALGVMGLFVFHGFSTGTMNQYRDEAIHGFYGNGQINTRGYLDRVYDKPWEHWIADYESLRPRLLALPGVRHLFPRVTVPALLQAGSTNVGGLGIGVDGAAESAFFRYNMVQGTDLGSDPDGIVLGVGLARSLNVKLGDRVTVLGNSVDGALDGVDLKLVGVFHQGGQMDNAFFKLPIAQAHRMLGTNKVESVAIGLDAQDGWRAFHGAAARQLPELDAVPFEKLDEVYYKHATQWLDAQFQVFLVIILGIVIFGILNSIAAGVLERKQEIGNLRANGESRWDVMRLLLVEGAALGALGALVGVVLGYLMVYTVLARGVPMPPGPGLTREFWIRIELQGWFVGVCLALGVVSTIVGTLFAGWRVVRLAVGEALRGVG